MEDDFVYMFAKVLFMGTLEKQLNWQRDKFAVSICDESVVVNRWHQVLAEANPASILATVPVKGQAFNTSGATAAPMVFTIPAGKTMQALLLHEDTGDPMTSVLVVHICLNRKFKRISDGRPFVLNFKNGIITP